MRHPLSKGRNQSKLDQLRPVRPYTNQSQLGHTTNMVNTTWPRLHYYEMENTTCRKTQYQHFTKSHITKYIHTLYTKYKYIQNSCLHPTPPWAIPCVLCPEMELNIAPYCSWSTIQSQSSIQLVTWFVRDGEKGGVHLLTALYK